MGSFENRPGSLFCKVVQLATVVALSGSWFGFSVSQLSFCLLFLCRRFKPGWPRVCTKWCLLLVRSRHGVSVDPLLQRKRLCQAILCENSAGLTCLAPTQRARSHKTSRLSSRSFHGVRFKTRTLSFALLASERILDAMMSWTIVNPVQAEVQAAFD